MAVEANLNLIETKELVDGKTNYTENYRNISEVEKQIVIVKRNANIFRLFFHPVFGTVRWLRGQRRCLVSNVSQYRFIYDVLEDHITSGDTSIDLEDLSHHITALASKYPNKVVFF